MLINSIYAWLITKLPRSEKRKAFGIEGKISFVMLATICHVYMKWYLHVMQSYRCGTKDDNETDPERVHVEVRTETNSNYKDATRNIMEMLFSMKQNVSYSTVMHTAVL